MFILIRCWKYLTVTFVLFPFHRTRTFITQSPGNHRVCAVKNVTFNNIYKLVTVWKRGRLNAPHWAIKATRQKVKDKPFLYKESKKNTSTRKNITEPPRSPEENTLKQFIYLLCNTKRHREIMDKLENVNDRCFSFALMCFFVVMSFQIWVLLQLRFYQLRNPKKIATSLFFP